MTVIVDLMPKDHSIKDCCAILKTGIINCIIVKDLSRIGRDYIEVGRMIKFYFNKKNVCFISVADGYDSQQCDNELYSPFYMYMKSIVNDEYQGIYRKSKNRS